MERELVYCEFGGRVWEVGGRGEIKHYVLIVSYKICHTIQVTKNSILCTFKLPSFWHISYNQFARLH